MTPRIHPVTEPDEEQRELLAKTLPGPDGAPLNVFATLAHLPHLLRRVNALGGYFFVKGGVAVRERELVILRTAAFVGSEYEIGQHRWIGRRAGLSEAEIEAALDTTRQHDWSPDDEALLTFTDELLESDTVGDGCWDALAPRYEPAQRAELLVLVGYYRMLGGLLNGLRVELDASVAGGVAEAGD